jgi:hypothetical protein
VDVGGEAVVVIGLRGEICTGARVCACWGVEVGKFEWRFQVGVFKVWVFSSRRFVNSWFPFIDGGNLPTTSR